MARSGRDRDSHLPAPEVVISNPDGLPQPPIDSTRRQPGVAMRLGLLLVAAALFAFGVMVGRTTLNVQPGEALRGQRPPATMTGASQATGASPSTSADRTSLKIPPPAGTATDEPGPGAATVPLRMADLEGACGRPVPIARVGYVAPLSTPVDMTILAGDPPRSVDLRTGKVGPPLLELDDGLFTDQFATDARGTVVVLRSCADPMDATVVRVPLEGEAAQIEIPEGWRTFGGLVGIDDEVWLDISPLGSATKRSVLATDGSGDIEPLPNPLNWLSTADVTSPYGRRLASVELNTDDTPGLHIEVTDQATGETAAVPGLFLGAAHPKLAFSPDSRWLVITVATLVGDRILLYGPDDLTGPYSLPGTVQHPNPGGLTI